MLHSLVSYKGGTMVLCQNSSTHASQNEAQVPKEISRQKKFQEKRERNNRKNSWKINKNDDTLIKLCAWHVACVSKLQTKTKYIFKSDKYGNVFFVKSVKMLLKEYLCQTWRQRIRLPSLCFHLVMNRCEPEV